MLPEGWCLKTVGEVVNFEYGKGLTKAKRDSSGRVPVYGSNGIVGFHSLPLVTKPCLIVGRKGAAGAVHKSEFPCWPIDTTYYVIPPEGVNLSFLYYLFSSLNFASLDRSTTIPGLNRNDAYSIRIPIPPLPEQERIVARIEELFTQLDAGVASLRRVQAALKRYKASVLKAACEGRLVPQDPNDEPAGEMLRRLGKRALADEKLPSLPQGWCWTNISGIGNVTGGLTKNSKRNSLKIKLPYLRVANVYANELRLNEILEIGVEESEIQRTMIHKDDLLVVEGNGSADQIGRVAIWKGSISLCLHQNHIIKVRFEPKEIAHYVLNWLLSDKGRHLITQVASSTSGLYTLSLSKVSSLIVPLPPLCEQSRIVAEVERCLSVANEIESAATAALARASRLRQAVLKWAFEGRLLAA